MYCPKVLWKFRSRQRKIIFRVLVLTVTGVSLYLLAPSLLEVFSSWKQLRTLSPYWIIPAVVFEAASFVSLWALQRIALAARDAGLADREIAATIRSACRTAGRILEPPGLAGPECAS